MKKIVLVLLAVLLIPTHAFAYTLSVKLVNKTGGELKVNQMAKIHVKGPAAFEVCFWRTDSENTIQNNDYALFTGCPATVQKWQRAITVGYSCDYPNKAMREVRYPKSKKWSDRDYPAKNGDRYTILVKKKDC